LKSTEYPYYEDRVLLEHSKSLNESRGVIAPSSSENEEDSIEVEGSNDKELFADAEEDIDDAIMMDELTYEKKLADAKSDFEKKLKEYQDQLATKDMDIIMLKVQIEDLEQKSEKIIDNVIAETQKHMQGEIKKYKKNHDQKVAKIISDAKEYFKQKNIENQKALIEAEKKIEQKNIENQKALIEAEKKIEQKNIENQKALIEAEKIEKKNTENQKALIEAEKKIEQMESEKEKSDDLIRRLKKSLELTERETSYERSLEEKVIQFKQKLEEQDSLLQRKLENRVPSPHFEAKKDGLMYNIAPPEKQKESPEDKMREQYFPKSSLPKETPQIQAPTQEKVISKQIAIEIQDALQKERKKYEKLESELGKNKQMIQQLTSEKKKLRRELENVKTIASTTEESKPKPKATLFDIISTILLIGANLLFIFVIYPNVPVSDWIESVGLNDLSFVVRILLTMFGVMISLFYFVKAREASSRRRTSKQKKKEGHGLNFLLGVIVIGVVLLAIFLLSSDFLFFMTGTLLILLAGLLMVIDRKKISS